MKILDPRHIGFVLCVRNVIAVLVDFPLFLENELHVWLQEDAENSDNPCAQTKRDTPIGVRNDITTLLMNMEICISIIILNNISCHPLPTQQL